MTPKAFCQGVKPPCYTPNCCSPPACGGVTLESYMISQAFSATSSFLLKMVGKHGCTDGSWKPSKASSRSAASLSSRHLKQLKYAESCFMWILKLPLWWARCGLLPLSCAWHVAKGASGCGAEGRNSQLDTWICSHEQKGLTPLPAGISSTSLQVCFAPSPSLRYKPNQFSTSECLP